MVCVSLRNCSRKKKKEKEGKKKKENSLAVARTKSSNLFDT